MTTNPIGDPPIIYVGYTPEAGSSSSSGTGPGPGDVDGDVILEQSETDFDEAGNVILMTYRQRMHDAAGTGSLGDPSTEPRARVTYTAQWYDGVGRQTASADYGTGGGSEPSVPESPPASSDTVLVSRTEYDDAGRAYKTIDPAGRVDRAEFDGLGRVVRTIQNYVEGSSSSSSSSGPCGDCSGSDRNVTVDTAYNADGQVLTLTAENPITGDQVTRYVYGTDIGGYHS